MAKGFTRVLIGLSALTSPIALATHATAQTSPATIVAPPEMQPFDAYVEKTRTEWEVPGLSIIVVQNDKIVFAKGYGVREVGKSDAVDIDTVFAIGSLSKAFTSTTLGLLVDEKKIAWDGIVQDYVPSFALNDPAISRSVTVRDLMSHRTGFVSGYGWMWGGSGFDRSEIIKRLRFKTDNIGFRDTFLYANEIVTLAGEIVPAVTGISWDAFLASRIFQPLGMTRSSSSVTALSGLDNVASPHGVIDGKLVTFPYRNIDNTGGSGTINSSARDMAQWLRLQLGGGTYAGKQIIAATTLNETHTGQVTIRGAAPVITQSKFNEYGLGWGVSEFRGHKMLHHTGGIDGMHSAISMIPAKNLGVVVLSNRLPSQVPTALALKALDTVLGTGDKDWSRAFKEHADAAEAKAKAATPAKPAKPVPPSLPLDRYAGTYSSAQNGTITIALNKGVLRLVRPAASATLKLDQRDRFLARWDELGILSIYGEVPVGFVLSATGDVIALDLGPDRFKRDPAPSAR